ncbi:MAG TPA: efflux transporter outer membrane subunit [Thermodesulfovibrionales bacterium]|nr:efflux transporter outer membrane subunit [Thermodesulfovibrionales bacterium]
MTAGCMAGPDFQRPEVAVSQNWMDAGDNRVKSEAADYRNWWQTFNDPVLDRLMDKAYRDNLSLRIAGVRVLEARALLGIAIGEIYPQTQQASGSLQYNRISEHGILAVQAQKFQYWQSEVGLNASWELDFWGKFRRGIESADAGWLATVADYDNALVSLTADVANSYITIRTLERRIDIARQNAETQNENLKIAEARFKYGAATELDVEQARTVLNSTLAAIPSLEAQLRQTEHALSVLLGLAPSDLSDYLKGSSEIPLASSQVVVGIPADLLRRRPDIRSAEYQAAAQSAQIGVAKADLYPAFSLTGSFGFLSTTTGTSHLSDLFKWPSRSIVAGPTFQWSILNYGQITNNVRVQDARLQELLIAYQNTVLSAQKDVEDNLAAFLRAQERTEYLAKSVGAAKSALDIAVKQYRAGVKDFTAVLLAQQSLLNEQDNLATTFGNISTSLVGVYRALGGGWEIREGKDLVPERTREEMERRTNWGSLLAPASYNPPAGRSPESLIRPPEW